ncbi:MAG: hypothetical protein HY735_09935 [Verrucomicrobia bacterium]|nr:hypothetical protein [Verrucomicrobiota bacterium]
MKQTKQCTARAVLIPVFLLVWSLHRASVPGAVLAAGPIRTQPSGNAPSQPPLAVASGAVTSAPRSSTMIGFSDRLDALGSTPGLSVEQESELLAAAVRTLNIIQRQHSLPRQEKDLFMRVTGQRLVIITETRARLAATRTEVAKVFLETAALVIASPALDVDEKRLLFQILGQEVLRLLSETFLTDQELLRVLPILKSDILNGEILKRIVPREPGPVITSLPIRSLAQGNLSGLGRAPPAAIRQFQEVIQTEADWKLWWDQLQAQATPKPDLPQVDFAKETVILVANGRLSPLSVSIQITSVGLAADYLVVTIREASKQPCEGIPSPLYAPFHAVAVPKSNLKPKFQLIIEDRVCVIERTPLP